MKAAVLTEINEPIQIVEVDMPVLSAGNVLIKISAASINHRDLWIQKGQYAGIKCPIILGSDGCGVIEKAFDDSNNHWIGKRVIIQPGFLWGDSETHQSKAYHILGLPTSGTFAEYLSIPIENVYQAPDFLTDSEAAALPLAGLTAYRALISKAELKSGEKVLISGMGGGVAFFAFQFALAIGAEVWVTSSSDHKIAEAIQMGAKGGFNYTIQDWKKSATVSFDVIIDSAGGPEFKHFLDIAAFGCRIAIYGGTLGNIEINPQKLFWKQIKILGSTMGSSTDFDAMLKLVTDKKIIPHVSQIFPLDKINEAFTYIDSQKQTGKVILGVI